MHTLPKTTSANLDVVTPTLTVGGDLSGSDADLAARQLSEICALGTTQALDVVRVLREQRSHRG